MVKLLLALATISQVIGPTKGEIVDYINNYINKPCQYLRYQYNDTDQKYYPLDGLQYFNEQNLHAEFNFTLFMDYTITERITHLWNLGDSLTITLAMTEETIDNPYITGTCDKILTFDNEEKKYKLYDLMSYNWDTTEPIVVNKIPATKVANEIYVLNEKYASNSELYKSGYQNGYGIGYNTGYGEGKVATTPLNNAFDLFKKISTSLSSFWNITILPGLNLGLLISIPITTGIVIWVIKALKE